MNQESSGEWTIIKTSNIENLELFHANDPLFYHNGIVSNGQIFLYKYVTIRALYSFLNYGDLKITFPEDANDPFEFISDKDIPKQQTSDEGFISLSEENDNPSLWGNYAEEYKGACIEFLIPFFTNSAADSELTAFLNAFSQEKGHHIKLIGARTYLDNGTYHGIGLITNLGDILYKCIYKDTPFSKDKVYTYPKNIPDDFKNIYFDCLRVHDKIATKSTAWQHEKEYRIALSRASATRLIFSNDNKKLYLSDRLTIFCSKIILAPYSPFSVDDAVAIMKNAEPWKRKVPNVVRAEFVKGQYKLNIPDSSKSS